MSKDKLRILIKILAESHMAFDLGDKIDIRWHRQADQPSSISSSLSTAKQGDNRIGSVRLSVRLSIRLSVRLFTLSCLNRLTFTLDILHNG